MRGNADTARQDIAAHIPIFAESSAARPQAGAAGAGGGGEGAAVEEAVAAEQQHTMQAAAAATALTALIPTEGLTTAHATTTISYALQLPATRSLTTAGKSILFPP